MSVKPWKVTQPKYLNTNKSQMICHTLLSYNIIMPLTVKIIFTK